MGNSPCKRNPHLSPLDVNRRGLKRKISGNSNVTFTFRNLRLDSNSNTKIIESDCLWAVEVGCVCI